MLYLVESCGSLLLVRRTIFHTHVHGEGQIHTFAGQCEPDLSMFEADFARSQWAKVTTLADNQALFLGPCSRAVCMPQGDSPSNRVWFLDDYKDFHHWHEYWHPKPFSPLPMISWRATWEMLVLHGSSLQTDAVGWTIVTSKAVKRTMCFSDRSKVAFRHSQC
jgi:hypothetical protein